MTVKSSDIKTSDFLNTLDCGFSSLSYKGYEVFGRNTKGGHSLWRELISDKTEDLRIKLKWTKHNIYLPQ